MIHTILSLYLSISILDFESETLATLVFFSFQIQSLPQINKGKKQHHDDNDEENCDCNTEG